MLTMENGERDGTERRPDCTFVALVVRFSAGIEVCEC